MQHKWDISYEEAVEIQKKLAKKIIVRNCVDSLKYIAGCDISFKFKSDIFYAVIVVLLFETLEIVEKVYHRMEVKFPYIPGLLSFREIPPLIEAHKKLKTNPDVFIFDGQGIAHPRRIGLASHCGLIFNKPSIGCAKSILTGSHKSLKQIRGENVPLVDNDEIVGAALCTKNKTKPIYISVGHKISLQKSIDIILKCNKGYKIPEPTRQAHIYAKSLISL